MNDEIDDGEVLLRGVKKTHLVWSPGSQTVEVALVCYTRREQDIDGLSVERKSLTTYEETSQRGRFPCFTGITAGEVKALGLTVRAKPNAGSGATIIGLPGVENPTEAGEWAARLAFAFRWDLAPSADLVGQVKVKYLASQTQGH
jgi:hypothetical protein